MKKSLLTCCSLVIVAIGCGASPEDKGNDNDGAKIEIVLANHDAWPATVSSARIAMTRTLLAVGCGTSASTLNKCWCRTAGAGCDFVGTPNSPIGVVSSLCSGDWTLDTAVSAAYTANACQAGTEITTTESTTPGTVTLPYGGTTSVNVLFQASSTLDVDVQFDG